MLARMDDVVGMGDGCRGFLPIPNYVPKYFNLKDGLLGDSTLLLFDHIKIFLRGSCLPKKFKIS